MAMLGIQTIAIGVKCLNCCTPYGIIALAVGAACVAFATAEAQEALGYGNWMKDGLGMSEGWYTGLMVTANVAAIAINLVGVKQCFKEGTLVETEEGLKPIEEIQVGDKVLAYDEETGGQAYKKVVQLFRNQTKEWHHIQVNGEEIVCTGGHPFYVAELDKFIPARKLKVGTKLLLSTGVCAIIEAIQVEQLEVPETTYNFEVEDFHTYYVTEAKVLVHNMCKGIEDLDTNTPSQPDKITGYTKHGINQAISRDGHGVSTKGVLDAFKNPNNVTYNSINKTFKYSGTNSVVVLNQQGKVVSTWAKSSIFWRF